MSRTRRVVRRPVVRFPGARLRGELAALAAIGLAVAAIGGEARAVPSAGQVASEPAEPTAAADRPPADDPVALLDGLERRRVTVAWDEQPLLRIVSELESVHGIPVSVDWTSLDTIGVDRRTLMTLRATDASALAVLEQLAVLAGDEFDRSVVEAWGGRVLLTTDAIADRLQVTRAYDVRDLLASPQVARSLRVWIDGDAGNGSDEGAAPESGGTGGDSAGGASGGDAGGDAGGEPDGDPPAGPAPAAPIGGSGFVADLPPAQRPGGPAERLLRTLLEHSDPEAWFRVGGDGARITERGGLLLVSAPASTHRLLRGAIESLRALDPSGLQLTARLVRIDPDAVDRIARRYAASSVAFARRVIESPDAEVLWTARGPVARDAVLSIEDRTSVGRFDLRLAPRWDAGRGRFVVAVEAGLRSDGAPPADRTGVATEVPLDIRGGAIALDLPHGAAAKGRLMLLVVPAGL